MGYIPYHPAYDQEKLHRFVGILQQAMDEGRPWPFPPLVAAGDFFDHGQPSLGSRKRSFPFSSLPVFISAGYFLPVVCRPRLP